MAEKQPRVQVRDLEGNAQLQTAADPRGLDGYVRPGEQEIGRPPSTNPMLQLSEALSKLEPTLRGATAQVQETFSAEELARGEKDFWDNREKWNEQIKTGAIPEGVSPYYQRGLQRAYLKQLGEDFSAESHAAFYGAEGAEARESNDPATMRKFLDSTRKAFYEKNLKTNKYSALDMQEVFHPALTQVERQMLSTHASYRVSEREKEYENLATSRMEGLADSHIGQLQATDDEATRQQVIARAAQEINDVLYHPDTGAVRNGMLASKGNQLLVDTITTKMIKTGNRDYAEILHSIKTKSGAPVGKTQYAQAKITAAEEHITDQGMKESHFKHWQDGLGFEARSKQRTEANWQREDQRWEKERAEVAKDEIATVWQRRVFEGLRRDPKEGTRVIDEVIREAEQINPKEAEHLRSMVHTVTKQRADYEDDQITLTNLRIAISKNPLDVKYSELSGAVRDKLIKPGTFMQLADDLDRAQQHGDHVFMRQPEFTSLLHKVEKSMAQSMGEDEYGEGAIRAAEAVGDFRDLANEWIETHPNGSAAAFRNYMRSQVQDVAERHNTPYGASQKAARQKQTSRGQLVVDEAVSSNKKQAEQEKAAQEAAEILSQASDEIQRKMGSKR